ncbi:MAG: DUF4062 domain-containing protein [Clostridiales bacterium]|nr:DUF4062 domain-containing protein [Clostridiales bacterium]
MDKRYQVFVSSTFEDLQEERKEVMQALLELDCIPAGMELFPASNDDQWSLIKRVIDDCDYYILIIGGRYGSENDKGISYTQMEFEYALSKDKPIISFLYKKPEDLPVKKTDNNAEKKKKLDNFRELAQKKLVRYWNNAVELGGVVSRSMVKLIKDFPTEGWVKSGSAVDETSLKEIARLQKENNELKDKLQAISTEAPKGTERFAHGDDEIKVKFSFRANDDCYNEYYDEYNDYSEELSYTWDTIFSRIAPDMIDECDESTFRDALDDLLENSISRIEEIDGNERLYNLRNFNISNESYNLIKVQLKALGLIELSAKRRSTKDNETYWTLTPYGEYYMTQLLAIRK